MRDDCRLAPRFPSDEQFAEAGIPPWIPRASEDSDAAHIAWNETTSVEVRLFVQHKVDRRRAIDRLLAQIEAIADSDDLSQPVAFLMAKCALGRYNGSTYASVGVSRPIGPLRPLQALIDVALNDLRRRQEESDPQEPDGRS